jgi:hypothetical protein
MSQYQEPPIYRAAYDLCLSVIRFVKDCHPDYKATMGVLLQKEALDLLMNVYRVNEAETVVQKVNTIKAALNRCYTVRVVNRLLLDLGVIKLETSISLDNKIEEAAKQLSGWKKSCEKVIIS